MRGKWTEGEWRLAELHKLGLYDNDGSAKILAGHGDDSVAVASVAAQAPMKRGQGSNLADPERDANARLMVAAKPLYEALVNTSALLRLYKGNLDPDVNKALAAADAALSLARTEPSQGEK